MKHIALTSLLLLSITGFAQTYSNASLNGNYTVQLSSTQNNSWGNSASCTYQGNTYTYSGGGQTLSTKAEYGVIAFDAAGNFTASITQAGVFDSTASNATVTITFDSQCAPTINNGYAVFDPPVKEPKVVGKYHVHSDGSGTLMKTKGSNGSVTFQLAGTATSTSISNTVMLTFFGSGTANAVKNTGIAIRQIGPLL